jgi:hypothetical protein
MGGNKNIKKTINAFDFMKNQQDKYSKIAGLENAFIKQQRNSSIHTFIKSQKNILKQVNPLGETFKEIRKIYATNSSLLANYEKTFLNLKDAIKVYNQNPYFEQLEKINKSLKEFNEDKKAVEDNVYHLLTVDELEIKNKKIEQLENEKKVLEDYKTMLLEKVAIDTNFIDNYLKKVLLKSQKKKLKKLTLNPNFDDFKYQVKTIHENTQTLFNSTLLQWENLFSNEIKVFIKPIELKEKINLSDLRLFLDKLKITGLVKNGRFGKMLEDVKAFSYNGNIITANQYKDAKQLNNYPNTLNSNKVRHIFKELKTD